MVVCRLVGFVVRLLGAILVVVRRAKGGLVGCVGVLRYPWASFWRPWASYWRPSASCCRPWCRREVVAYDRWCKGCRSALHIRPATTNSFDQTASRPGMP